MTPEVQLAPEGRSRGMRISRPVPVVRLAVASAAVTHLGRRSEDAARAEQSSGEEDDNLRPARGILFGLMLGLGLWTIILYLAWILAS